MKNVLIMTQLLTGGGAERIAADLSRGLANYYNVYLLVYQARDEEYPWSGTRIDLNLFSTSKIGKVFCAIKRYIKIRGIKRKYKIDYSLSFVPHVDLMNVLTKRRNEKTIVDIVTNTSVASENSGKVAAYLRKYSMNKADKVVADSVGIAMDLVDNYGFRKDEIDIIYDTCDIEAIEKSVATDEQCEWFETGKKYICTMGSMRYPKGQWHLVKAFYLLKNKNPNIKLIILGDGPYRKRLENLIDLFGIKDEVLLPGFVDNPHGVLKKCDVFVLSSLYEGLPYVLIEAMVCKIPIISTDCKYGPREIIDENRDYDVPYESLCLAKHGVLVPSFSSNDIDFTTKIEADDERLAQAIEMLLFEEKNREKYTSRDNSFIYTFDYKTVSEEWKKVIESME